MVSNFDFRLLGILSELLSQIEAISGCQVEVDLGKSSIFAEVVLEEMKYEIQIKAIHEDNS